MSLEKIQQQISLAEEALRPCTDQQAAIYLEKTLSHFGMPDSWEAAQLADDYLDYLTRLPLALLKKSYAHILQKCKFFPKIADFMEPVEDELAALNTRLLRLRTARDAKMRQAQ